MNDESTVVYRDNCHCGRYRYELSLSEEITTTTSCTCNLCAIKGCLWLMPPNSSFKVIRDDGYLTEYTTNALSSKFCSCCGTTVLGEHLVGPTSGQFMVNVRAIQGVNPFRIESNIITLTMEDEQDSQKQSDPESTTSYTFSCHCGKLYVELDGPIQDLEVKEDNCSLCVRNAYIGVYPTKDQVRVYGRPHSFENYGTKAESTGRKWSSTVYCRTCGVFMLSIIYGPPLSIFDGLPPDRKQRALEVYHKNINLLLPLNMRTMKGVPSGLTSGSTLIQRSDEGTPGYDELLEPWRSGD